MNKRRPVSGLARKQMARKKEQKEWWKDSIKNKKKGQHVEKSTSDMTTKELKDLHNKNEDESMSDALTRKKYLPILVDGQWVQREEEIFPEDTSENLQAPLSGEEPQITAVEMLGKRHKLIRQYKIFIAHHATKLQVNPKLVDSFNALVDLLKENNPLICITVRTLAACSLMKVFKDILPNYKINKNLLNAKMYKEKLDIVKGEFVVLEFYQKYLKLMEANLNEVKNEIHRPAMQELQRVLLKCFGRLLTLYPKFNFAMNICGLLIEYLNDKELRVRELVFSYLKEVVEKDTQGVTSLTVVQKVYGLVTRRKLKVKPEVLRLLLHLNVDGMRNTDDIKKEKKEAEKAIYKNAAYIKKISKKQDMQSRKEKKEKKKKAILSNKIAEIESKVISKQVSIQQAEILKLVLALLFKLLKSNPKSDLRSVVYEGLAKFSHLINVEYFMDILKEFDAYLQRDDVSLKDSLNCVRTAFVLIHQNDGALGVDGSKFYKYIYAALPKLVFECNEENITSLIQCLNEILLKNRERLFPARIMAFAKKLTTTCVSLPHHSGQMPVLVLLHSIIKSFPCNESLLEVDPDDCLYDFDAYNDDPDYCYGPASKLFDLALTSKSYHPEVSRISQSILSCTTDPNGYVRRFNPKQAHTLYKQYDIGDMVFNPPIEDLKSMKEQSRKRPRDSDDIHDMYLHEMIHKKPKLKKVKYGDLYIPGLSDVISKGANI